MLFFDVAAAPELCEELRQRSPAPMPQAHRARHFAYAFGTIGFREIGQQFAFGDFWRAFRDGWVFLFLFHAAGCFMPWVGCEWTASPAFDIVCGARKFSRNF